MKKNAVKTIPFTEDDLELLVKDVENIFGNIIKEKSGGNPKRIDYKEDTLVYYFADFMGMSVEALTKLYEEIINDGYVDYDKFRSYIGETKLSLQGYVMSFVDKLINEGFVEDVCDDYGEPGYKKEKEDNLIITADWNYMSQGVLSIIEENGYDIEWPDEWICDNNNEKIYRSQPDSYSWEPSYFIVDGEVHGISDNEELYLSTMINEPHRLVSASVDLIKYGFVDIEEACRETGMYGTYEDPKDVFDKFKDEYAEMVVQTCSIGQFAINWKVWGRNKKEKK